MGTKVLTSTALAIILVTVVGTALPAAAADTAPAIAWGPCTDERLTAAGIECATLTVPGRRSQPNGPKVTIALARHVSTGASDERIGSIVFNPGGPGGSGVTNIAGVWSVLPDIVKQRFDLVSWDPRGVGLTSNAVPVGCATPYPKRPLTGPIDWAAIVRQYAKDLAAANAACVKAYGQDVRTIGTMENVADLEAIRAALGEPQLTYWGMSYGTRIGYVYALQYPERVRAMVLDGSIDPGTDFAGLMEGAAGPDQALGPFAAAYPKAARGLNELLAYLDKHTLALPDGQRLDRWVVRDFIFGSLAQQSFYPELAKAIDIWHKAVFTTGAGREAALALAAKVAAQANSMPNTGAGGVFSITNCADYADRPTMATVTATVLSENRRAPRYGATMATQFGLGCAGLTFSPDPIPRITTNVSDVPVLILGSSRDAATVVQWTARMSRAFPNSRTVTYAGGQHVTWGLANSPCVDDVANAYVISQALPVMDAACSNTVHPQGG